MAGPLLSLFRGPAPPPVRADALSAVYLVRRGAVAVRRNGEERELATGRSWSRLAQAMLEDALEAAPPWRLVRDYSRFIVPRRGEERAISGAEVQAWLDTWRPSVLSVLGSNR